MKVEAHDMLVENLLRKGKFIIPDYQREYDWEDEHINELLEDIDETPIDENYFIGHMVFEGVFNGFEFKVVDGQQRITTLTILLSAIRDKFIELGETNLAEAIHTTFIFGKDKNFTDYVVLENRMPYPLLQAYVQSKPNHKNTSVKPIKSGEKKIKNAYDKIIKHLSKLDRDNLIILRDKILKLEVIFVAASDQVDASSIFMTLNATGKDLSPLDLVKNHIFSLYPKQPHIEEPNDSWKSIIENTAGTEKFLNNFFASRYKKVSDKRIFKFFLKTIKTEGKEKISTFLSNLKNDASIFRCVTKPKVEDWSKSEYDIYESIYAITVVFKIEVANSLLMSLIREYKQKSISKAYIVKALGIIEKFHFINNAICSNRSSGFDIMYAKMAKKLFEAVDKEKKHIVINHLREELEKKIPSQEKFESNFDNKLYFLDNLTKQKPLVQFALNKIERRMNMNSIFINTSIEHIFPEKYEKWEPLKNKDLIKNIGNLVILDANLNSAIGNKLYPNKKKVIIEKSSFLHTKEVFNNNEQWSDEEIIKRRSDLIIELYTNVWKCN